jgi:hypothetical protein
MKNKILTEEIIRIQKIMGVSTNLIMEASPNTTVFAEKGAKELWATIERIFTKEGEELTDQGLKNTIRRLKDVVGKESVEDIEKIMNGSDNLRTKKTNIINSLSKDEIIQKNIVDKIESNNLFKKEIEFLRDKYIREPQIKSFLDDVYIKCLKKKSGDVKEAKELMRRAISASGLNFPKESLERYLDTSTANKVGLTGWDIKLANVEAPTKLETRNFVKNIDPTTGLEWESPAFNGVNEDINKFQILLKKYGLNKAIEWLKDSKYYEKFWVQYIRNFYWDTFTNWKKVQEVNINNAKKFIQNAYELEAKNEGNAAARELQKALSQILLYKRNPKISVDEVIKKFITENPNLNEETKRLFLKSKVAGNIEMRKFIEDIADDVNEQLLKGINVELISYAELFPVVGAFRNEKTNAITTIKQFFTIPIKRWFNLLTWKDPRGAYEVILSMAKRGVQKEYSSRLMSFFLFHVLIIPAVISILKSWNENIGVGQDLIKLHMLKKLCDEGLLTKDCDKINQELVSLKFMQDEDYIRNYFKELPYNIGMLFGEDFKESESVVDWKDMMFMTYYDEAAELGYKGIQNSPFPFIGQPKTDYLINVMENLSEKTKNELRKMGVDIEKGELTKQIEDIYLKKAKNSDEVKTVKEVIGKVKEKTQEISIVDDIKPAAPCLFTDSSAGGWTVELTEKGYVTHNQDWSQKYYLDVTKKDGVTTVYYKNTTTKTCN